MKHIYIEKQITEHAFTKKILSHFPHAQTTVITSYGEVFNTRKQNFRLQKAYPSAIIAQKYGKRVLPIPASYALGAAHNYYFSHAYNCPYDCRYCFLQAMYSSAHYVFFINYSDFFTDIQRIADSHYPDDVHFFSGYDCDSLAFEPVTAFATTFIPFFRSLDNAFLELRTKSTAIRNLLTMQPADNVIVAFSLAPREIAMQHEHKTPSVDKRLDAMEKLAARGWKIGLRFDPLIWHRRAEQQYKTLCHDVFRRLPECHSVTIGSLRLTGEHYTKLVKLYPEERIFAAMTTNGNMAGYRKDIEQQLISTLRNTLAEYIEADRIFCMH